MKNSSAPLFLLIFFLASCSSGPKLEEKKTEFINGDTYFNSTYVDGFGNVTGTEFSKAFGEIKKITFLAPTFEKNESFGLGPPFQRSFEKVFSQKPFELSIEALEDEKNSIVFLGSREGTAWSSKLFKEKKIDLILGFHFVVLKKTENFVFLRISAIGFLPAEKPKKTNLSQAMPIPFRSFYLEKESLSLKSSAVSTVFDQFAERVKTELLKSAIESK